MGRLETVEREIMQLKGMWDVSKAKRVIDTWLSLLYKKTYKPLNCDDPTECAVITLQNWWRDMLVTKLGWDSSSETSSSADDNLRQSSLLGLDREQDLVEHKQTHSTIESQDKDMWEEEPKQLGRTPAKRDSTQQEDGETLIRRQDSQEEDGSVIGLGIGSGRLVKEKDNGDCTSPTSTSAIHSTKRSSATALKESARPSAVDTENRPSIRGGEAPGVSEAVGEGRRGLEGGGKMEETPPEGDTGDRNPSRGRRRVSKSGKYSKRKSRRVSQDSNLNQGRNLHQDQVQGEDRGKVPESGQIVHTGGGSHGDGGGVHSGGVQGIFDGTLGGNPVLMMTSVAMQTQSLEIEVMNIQEKIEDMRAEIQKHWVTTPPEGQGKKQMNNDGDGHKHRHSHKQEEATSAGGYHHHGQESLHHHKILGEVSIKEFKAVCEEVERLRQEVEAVHTRAAGNACSVGELENFITNTMEEADARLEAYKFSSKEHMDKVSKIIQQLEAENSRKNHNIIWPTLVSLKLELRSLYKSLGAMAANDISAKVLRESETIKNLLLSMSEKARDLEVEIGDPATLATHIENDTIKARVRGEV
ncbi:unnamed protein product [Discosporangium mesarthrocarpum]